MFVIGGTMRAYMSDRGDRRLATKLDLFGRASCLPLIERASLAALTEARAILADVEPLDTWHAETRSYSTRYAHPSESAYWYALTPSERIATADALRAALDSGAFDAR